MPARFDPPLLAVDIGNTRMKVGLFTSLGAGALPVPEGVWHVASHEASESEWQALAGVLTASRYAWRIASVNRPAEGALSAWIAKHRPRDYVRRIEHTDLPLAVDVPAPEKVGIDRLLAAVSANRLRRPDRAAIVIGLGTAFTVDLTTADGTFRGGAILPGMAMAGRALFERTDLLPHVEASTHDEPPAPLGRSTIEAIHSGLFWGALGGVREVTSRLSAGITPAPEVFVTGGVAAQFAQLLGDQVRHVPEMTLEGIVLAERVRA